MNYYLAGTGRMAHFLAARLSAGGHTCAGLWGRDADKARALAEKFQLPLLAAPQLLTDGPDACLLAVADDAVGPLAAGLDFRQTTAVCFSGALPLAALQPVPRAAVVWPIYSITAGTERVHRSIPCAWEATVPAAEPVALAVGAAIGGLLHRSTEAERRKLHLAAVLGNNFTNHLLALCETFCREQGLPFALLHPLLQQTFERATSGAPPAAFQTGPAVRGDETTMAAHRALLEDNPGWSALYAVISQSIAALHRR